MEAYLRGLLVWEAVESDVEAELPENPTLNQLKVYEEKMQIFNLRKKFELLKMKETENVKEYIDRVMKVVNRMRLMGEDLPEKKIVEKVMVTLLERFEAKFSLLEGICRNSLFKKLANALQAVE
ncbi:UNVERIFIED_CONTAM: hypothetical protein Slati_0846700 [Sesamum latifolium]|uniref:Uncharacterized protein n=1 Tax=Sesamum latifolium TaxID=2727402 RepID=A0AAW2XNC3_9LAMI